MNILDKTNMKKIVNISSAPKPIAPYSQAVLVKGFLYVSGQIPVDPVTSELNTGDIKTQTKQVMENIRMILKEVEMDFSNIVKCNIFVADMNNFKDVNEVYGSYFPDPPPARETVEVSKLPMNSDIEISCIAAEA